MNKMEKPTTPDITYQEAKQLHESVGRGDRFTAYERMGQNRFVRKLLYQKQHGRCPICGRIIDEPYISPVLHHSSYNYFCGGLCPSIPMHKVFSPHEGSDKSQDKIYSIVPNCEFCWYNNPELSERCLSSGGSSGQSIWLLHRKCHEELHNK